MRTTPYRYTRAFLTVAATFAELEAEIKRENVREGITAACDQGKWHGRPPFGFDVGTEGYLVPNDDYEKAVVALDTSSRRRDTVYGWKWPSLRPGGTMTRSDPHGSPSQTNSDPNDISRTDEALSAIPIMIGAYRRLRTIPRVLAVLVLAGLVMTGIGWLRLYDPIPTGGYVGIQGGRFSVLFNPPVMMYTHTNTLFSSLVGLKPQWFAWAIGLELLEVIVVAWSSAYVLARLLQKPLTTAAAVRYTGLVAVFHFGLGIHIEGAGLLVAIPAFLIWMFVLVRLFASQGS